VKLCAAQIEPVAGNIDENIRKHAAFIRMAAGKGAELILFPELSLTGYEPKLARALRFEKSDARLAPFQELSDRYRIIICIGLPAAAPGGIQISLVIFRPGQERAFYSKQILHTDEYPYFIEGTESVLIDVNGERVAPAICYESLQPQHAEAAAGSGATVYLASVAKSANGLAKAEAHYPQIAEKHRMHVLMANSVGASDDFFSAGSSAAWNNKGEKKGALNAASEGLLLYETERGEVETLVASGSGVERETR
jgi:predicted amidohydrolase